MTSIYQAIMKTADVFERNPRLFNFYVLSVPECGAPGCAIGYIAHHLGRREDEPPFDVNFESVLPVDTSTFYRRMTTLTRGTETELSWGEWTHSAALCVTGLRAYAAKYHAEPVADPAFTRFKALLSQDQPQRERESV